jgi:predicted YcjX-like family ATPase
VSLAPGVLRTKLHKATQPTVQRARAAEDTPGVGLSLACLSLVATTSQTTLHHHRPLPLLQHPSAYTRTVTIWPPRVSATLLFANTALTTHYHLSHLRPSIMISPQ